MKTFLEQLSLVLAHAAIVQGLFFALLLNNKSIRKSRANLFLSILLLAMSFSILHMLYTGLVMHHFALKAYPLGDPTFFLIAPLLWFYTKELTGHRVERSYRLARHFIPFMTIIFCSIFFKFLSADHPVMIHLNDNRQWVSIVFWVCVVIQFSGYQFFMHQKWLNYQRLMEQEVSNTENVNISWVRFFLGVFLFINFFFLITLMALLHKGNIFWLNKVIYMLFSLSVFALGYKGMLQKEIFYHHPKETPLPQPAPSAETEVKKTDPELISRLLRYMEEKKPYLDPELTLSSLAKDLGLSRSLLSQLINEGLGDNFYNFINKYRIEQVKKLMVDPAMKNYNMLGLALEAGFKSKSTFNLIFKRFTGLTPTEYVRNLSK